MNRQTLKRLIAALLVGALVLSLLPMLLMANAAEAENFSVGVIGGADGPTAVFVSGNRGGLLSTLLLIAGAVFLGIGLYTFLKKHRK